MSAHLYVISPSGAVRDKAAFKRGVCALENLGLTVEVDPSALASYQRFAGDDADRLAALNRSTESQADWVLISRGGYGLSRLLHKIPFKQMAKAVERGTQFIGFSDFTCLQMGLLAQTGAGSWAGASVVEGFGALEGPNDTMMSCFLDLLHDRFEGCGWMQPNESLPSGMHFEKFHAKRLGVDAKFHLKDGLIWGGNLSMVSSLVGTPFFPSFDDGFLFLEDVGESPYRVERMLMQLLHAGVLARQQAIVLGQFTEFKLSPHDRGFRLLTVINWLRSQLKVPVICGLPFGHLPKKVFLPLGRRADLVVQGREVLLLWG
jgi:muramoyltetrapeptide carboxypeptidase